MKLKEEKLIFIVVDINGQGRSSFLNGLLPEQYENASLAGDINLFFGKEAELENAGSNVKCAEVSIMIAEPLSQRKGLGYEAVKLIMKLG